MVIMCLKNCLLRRFGKLNILKSCSFNYWKRCFSALPTNAQQLEDHDKLFALQKFIKSQPSVCREIEENFAQPYTTMESVVENMKLRKHALFKPSDNALYNLYASGHLVKPAVNDQYILSFPDEVQKNIDQRKVVAINVQQIIDAHRRIKDIDNEIVQHEKVLSSVDGSEEVSRLSNMICALENIKKEVERFYLLQLLAVPNKTCPSVGCETERTNLVLEKVGVKPVFDHEIYDHIHIGKRMKLIRQDNMLKMVGQRNSFFVGAAAELEQALIQFSVDRLKQRGFMFISVPNILKDAVFTGAGLVDDKMDTMLYSVQNTSEPNFCLSGTSEVGLCAYFSSHAISIKDLPLKVCSVSTCYRRETGTRYDRKGIFRVHQFSKVEMFGVTANESGRESGEMLEEFVEIQKQNFKDLGLHFDVVNMPASELGLPAYKKIDVEAWFPGRNKYDEISSASNCTDFQSRRLHILYKNENRYKFAHTVNATACAVPRMIIALLENGQTADNEVVLPSCLHPYMNGKKVLKKEQFRTLEYVGVEQSKHKQKKIQQSIVG